MTCVAVGQLLGWQSEVAHWAEGLAPYQDHPSYWEGVLGSLRDLPTPGNTTKLSRTAPGCAGKFNFKPKPVRIPVLNTKCTKRIKMLYLLHESSQQILIVAACLLPATAPLCVCHKTYPSLLRHYYMLPSKC